jgi:hypothetical protein
MLQPSLPNYILLDLGLTNARRSSLAPWTFTSSARTLPTRGLSANTQLIDVFDRLDRLLLLLGAPRAGKTTLLLTLVRDLLQRAAQDPKQPIPMVFPLSSWAERRRPLAPWIVDALSEQYDVPCKTGQTWVNAGYILPLLDGLDEVATEHRTACVEAINTFRQEHCLLPLVVCSRMADYKAMGTRLRLQGVLVVLPLTPSQVEGYLAQVGQPLAAVREALHDDPTLWELLDTPLMRAIMTLTYAGEAVEALCTSGTLEARRQHLCAAYLERMFQRRSIFTRYSRQQTEDWLVWLAWQILQHSQTLFHIEQLQIDWLPREQRWRSMRGIRVGTRLLAALGCALDLGLGVGLSNALGIRLGFGLSGRWDPEKRDIQRLMRVQNSFTPFLRRKGHGYRATACHAQPTPWGISQEVVARVILSDGLVPLWPSAHASPDPGMGGRGLETNCQ